MRGVSNYINMTKYKFIIMVCLVSFLYENFGQGISSCTGDVRSGRMESNIEYTFIKLLPMCRNLLNTGLALQVPQPDTAVVAPADQIEAVLVHRQAGDAVQVSHHAVHQLARLVVVEPDVAVLMIQFLRLQAAFGLPYTAWLWLY